MKKTDPMEIQRGRIHVSTLFYSRVINTDIVTALPFPLP